MARNRQKAKERQARRKAQQQRSGDGSRAPADGARRASTPPRAEPRRGRPDSEPPEPAQSSEPPESRLRSEPAEPAEPVASDDGRDEAVADPHLRAGAPPEDVGRSDQVLRYEQDLEADEEEDEDHFDPDEDVPEEDLAAAPEPRRADAERHKDRPRFVQFLIAVWAELQRVQWPDRPALTTLTGVVLGFVLLAGGYLGLLDAIFSELIQAIL